MKSTRTPTCLTLAVLLSLLDGAQSIPDCQILSDWMGSSWLQVNAPSEYSNYASTAQCPLTDCQALNVWLSMDPNFCCSESRVFCNINGRITKLDLNKYGINGAIPLVIKFLDQLVELYVSIFIVETCLETISLVQFHLNSPSYPG